MMILIRHAEHVKHAQSETHLKGSNWEYSQYTELKLAAETKGRSASGVWFFDCEEQKEKAHLCLLQWFQWMYRLRLIQVELSHKTNTPVLAFNHHTDTSFSICTVCARVCVHLGVLMVTVDCIIRV